MRDYERYGMRYAGTIYVSRDRSKIRALPEYEVKDFMGNRLNFIERVDEMILPIMEKDGFTVVDLDA